MTEEQIIRLYGRRCAEHCDDCCVCEVWAMHDLIETQAREIERLREALREVFEEWAGSEGFIPETAPEGYLLQLTKRMADIASAALKGDSHDQ